MENHIGLFSEIAILFQAYGIIFWSARDLWSV